MSTAILEAPAVPDWDQLLSDLGGIPAHRIVRDPAPGTATVEDCIRITESKTGPGCELVDGTLVRKAEMAMEESALGSWISKTIYNYVDERDLGFVSGEQGTITLWEGRIRIPDIAFIPWGNARGAGRAAAPTVVPAIVVEVLSEGNTAKEIAQKREEFFSIGLSLFWEIDPRDRSIREYTTAGVFRTLGLDDSLDGGSALPGFSLSYRDIFARYDRIATALAGK